jgi:hypothetical protein
MGCERQKGAEMTNEDAIEVLKNGYMMEIMSDEAQEAIDVAIKALEQEPILDKIRAEFISLYPSNFAGEPELGGSSCVFSLNKILCIIDKYKAESEDKE